MLVKLDGLIGEQDILPFKYPSIKELKALGCRSVCLGSYIPWNVKEQYKIINRELGWKGDRVEGIPPEYCYEKIECYMQGVRDYIKFIKRGYSRPTHLTSIDIRNKRISRKKALILIKKYEGKRPSSLDLFLGFVGLSEKSFMKIAMSHSVCPHKHNSKETKFDKKLYDYNSWSGEGKMPQKEKDEILKKWQEN